MNYYLKALKQYVDFSGRARRKEYWMFVLFNLIFAIVAAILDNVIGSTMGVLPYGVIYILYSLALLLPGLAAGVRRLHDTGRNGWWMLIVLIPFIGSIWLLVLLVLDGDVEENEYGSNPKEVLA
ncbi:DUF805 domain-containing protein [Labilibaculum sp. DW002]|uniref:DUF805 domain-containing protein n=1 Tax=Paralabilibaculum antarcticum TaxID=2912572 RepID=A0ABT5VNN1_9BACT|nr:DUF805 domain-containing protein [Labilibaculum sp. DW002]MDE5417052.1 DUF805 domain-containing protein [Labilibaculum sp. DW002]